MAREARNHQSRWHRTNYLTNTFLVGLVPYFKTESSSALVDLLEIGERAAEALEEIAR